MLVTKNALVEKSDRKYDLPVNDDVEKTMLLEELSGVPLFTKITCEAKVLRVDDVTETANKKKLQNAWVADSSGMAKITLWENDVDKLMTNRSQRLNKSTVYYLKTRRSS